MTSPELADRTALVTGAGRGIGQAIAVALAEAGADVVLTSRSDAELAQTAELIRDLGRQAWPISADVSDRADVARVHAFAAENIAAVDIVVNNAGNLVVAPFVPLPDSAGDLPAELGASLTYEMWRSSYAVHVDGAFNVLQEFAPAMLARRNGRVINIVSSTLGRTAPFTTAYDSAKGALAQLTRSLAFEWARHGVTVNALAVGQIKTAMTATTHDNPAGEAWLMKRIPMKRVGEQSEVGRLVAFLASDHARFLTGQIIGLDGGETL